MDTSVTYTGNKYTLSGALIFLSSYLVIRTGFLCDTSSATLLSAIALMGFCLAYLKVSDVQLSRRAVPFLILSLAFIVSVFLNGNLMLRKVSLIASFLLFLMALFKGTDSSGLESVPDPAPAEMIQCYLYGIDAGRITVSGRNSNEQKWTARIMPVLLRILLGFTLCAPVLIFALLMLSYDSAFCDLLSDIFSFDIADIFQEAGFILYTVPLFLYLYLSISSYTSGNSTEKFDSTALSRLRTSTGWFSPVTVVSMVLPVLALYTVFFVSQWDYFTLAFHGSLPEGYSYAEYAREGFFQLCAVSAVNLLMMLGCTWFSNIKEDRNRLILKLVTVAVSVYSLILILTAASKMYLYIRQYGLTPLRVYSSWGMLVLAAVFVLFIIKQFLPEFPVYSACIMCAVALLLVLCISDPDSRIAEYNTSQFINGDLEEVDITMLHGLGDPAVPSLIRLNEYYHSLSDEERAALVKERNFRPQDIEADMLRSYYENTDVPMGKWYSITLPYILAKTAVLG